MADVAFVATIVAFFGLAALFVRFCDNVIGANEEVMGDAPGETDQERLAA